jgi:hypothetical protein
VLGDWSTHAGKINKEMGEMVDGVKEEKERGGGDTKRAGEWKCGEGRGEDRR